MKPLRSNAVGHKPDSTLPLINIVLLLVLAFMMAGTIAAPLPTDFDPLRSETGLDHSPLEAVIIFNVDAEGNVFADGSADPIDDMPHAFNLLSIENGRIELRLDARAPANTALKILAQAEASGVEHIDIVTLDKR